LAMVDALHPTQRGNGGKVIQILVEWEAQRHRVMPQV